LGKIGFDLAVLVATSPIAIFIWERVWVGAIVVLRKIQNVEDLPAHLDLAKLESRFESSTHK